MIGRKKEMELLTDTLHGNRSEFIAIYGRRRVGKTFLNALHLNNSFLFN